MGKGEKARNPLNCGTQCARITLIALNVVFLLCGIAFLVLGVVFRFGGDELKEEIKPTFEMIEFNDYDAYTLLNSVGIIFIVIGVIVIIFSLFGFIGAVWYIGPCLVIYAILLMLCLILELAGVILFFIMEKEFEDAARKGLKKSIEEANEGNEDLLKATKYMFDTFECCRVDDVILLPNFTSVGDTCGGFSAKAYSEDCYEALKDWVKQYQTPLIVIGICVMIVELMLIIFACCIFRASRREELV